MKYMLSPHEHDGVYINNNGNRYRNNKKQKADIKLNRIVQLSSIKFID